MTISRRDVLKALAATAALRACGAAWPFSALSAQQPSARLWVNKHMNLSEPVWRHYDARNSILAGMEPGPGWRGGFRHLGSIVNDAQAMGRRAGPGGIGRRR